MSYFHTGTGTEPRFIQTNAHSANKHYGDNKLINSKYTPLTFLPKIFVTHLRRFMNIYYILIGLLQLWNEVSTSNWYSIWASIILIFAITFIREGYDDFKQHARDDTVNKRKYSVIRDGKEIELESEKLTPGDIVKLQKNEESPADLVLLVSGDESGKCYLETSTLDGETSLKEKKAINLTKNLSIDDLMNKRIQIKCSPPNSDIDLFDGTIEIDERNESINNFQLIHCGTFLKYTEYIYGVVCYNGTFTKIGMNVKKSTTKWTQIEKFFDKCNIIMFVFQILFAVIWGVIGNWKQNKLKKSAPYLMLDIDEGTGWYIIYFKCLLLTSMIIPKSFKVIVDVCKIVYAVFITNDSQMYDFKKKIRPIVNNTNIIEDLGQIEYIFCDKTGTITENKMFLKKISVQEQFFGHNEISDNIYDDTMLIDFLTKPKTNNENEDIQFNWILKMVENLALCNTIKQIKLKKNKFKYEGSSPEEISFLEGLTKLGLSFVYDNNQIKIEIPSIGTKTYEKIKVLPFTNSRRIMSVIVRDIDTNKFILLSKGSCEVIKNISTNGCINFEQQVEIFSSLGLRVMGMSFKEITREELDTFLEELNNIHSQNISNREENEDEIFKTFERNQNIIGATAIEDKLRKDVPSTIEILREAGIRIWMVTGDLINTAIKIACTAKLIVDDGPILNLTKLTDDENQYSAEEILQSVKEYIEDKPVFYLALEGSKLTDELLSPSMIQEFALIASKAKSVICARVSPKQKAILVKAIQKLGKITLAIGDGINDIPMIKESHIGIGIFGKDSFHASNISDIAISEFYSLQKLLLIHGRFSCYRTSYLTQFCFYKSYVFSLLQISFLFWNGFSGAKLFNDFNIFCYNVIFTILPGIFIIYDKDVDDETIYLHPYLYSDSRLRYYCNARTFFWWIVRSIYHALCISIIVNFSIEIDSVSIDGIPIFLSEFQQIQYSCVILTVLVTVTLETKFYTSLNFIFIWGNWLFYILVTFFASLFNNISICRDLFGALWRTYTNPLHWIIIISATSLATMPILFFQSLFSYLVPSRSQKLREFEIQNQAKFKPPYLVDKNQNIPPIFREVNDPKTVWDVSHNVCTPIFALCQREKQF